MAITSAGVGSGLPLEDMITSFLSIERAPRKEAIDKKEALLETQISGVGTLKSAMAKFNDVLKKLADASSLMANKTTISYKGSSEGSLPFSVTTSDLVARGTFDVTVDALAQGSQLKSAALTLNPSSDAVGSGNLTFSAGGKSFNVAVAPGDTLETVRDNINSASDNFGVQVNLINTDAGVRLVYNSEVTGSTNGLSVTGDDPSLAAISSGMTETRVASDARITVDGEQITSSTNKFQNAISGLNIEVNALTDVGEKATLNVANDTEGAQKLIKEFVDGYNALRDQLATLTNPKSGSLAFDPTARQIQGQLAQLVGVQNSDAPTGLQSLYELGISVDNTGRLAVSSVVGSDKTGQQRLDSALANNLRGVGALFAGANGIATKMTAVLDSYVGDDGSLEGRYTDLVSERREIEDRRADLEEFMADYENTLRKRYAALDSVVAQYNSTSSYLTGIFQNMNASNKK